MKVMIRSLSIAALFCISSSVELPGQHTGYQIKGHLAGYERDSIFLGYYYGDKQYLTDTAIVVNGAFAFEAPDTLKHGVYLIVMPPDNRFFQLMVSGQGAQHFSFTAEMDDIEGTISFDHSTDNSIFYDNLKFLAQKRRELEAINKQREEQPSGGPWDSKLAALNDEVTIYQRALVERHPGSLTAALIKSGWTIELPEFEGQEDRDQLRFQHYRQHYFDHVQLGDNRLIRAPQHVLHEKVTTYVEKMTVQHPDSIIKAIDYLLAALEPAEESYKYYLVKFLNDYAQSRTMGLDAVYVHLALNYYDKGKASWIEDEQLAKIVKNARELQPILIGNKAANVVLQLADGSDVMLYEIDATHLILIFWAHDCGHCKESMPQLMDFFKSYDLQGLKVLSVCTKMLQDEPACWDFVKERNLLAEGWINASDQRGGRSYMHTLFNIRKTPKLFVLDHDKKIIGKDLAVEQLGAFLQHIIQSEQ